MCLSPGRPPLPVANDWAKCGPLVPGTTLPPPGKQLADLNPCPLNACCSTGNQCGTAVEYCTITKSTTGSPGTAGCISNCGRDIINNQVRPATFMSVGYFQPGAANRPCLRMDITRINTTQYTHIHYAFATITNDLRISVDSVNDFPDQWAKFLRLQGVKRIVSFGAGSIGDERFRQAVNTNITEFADNIASFVKKTPQIDGIEFDWEFPKTEKEGLDYAQLITLVRDRLPGKILSAAVPSGFWTLWPYPVSKIGEIVDYVVFMTYDMHGQWNFKENYVASSGCPQGKCVRSHVNMTETMDSLALITKAGVQAAKVVVGLASYGRSFELVVPGCSSSTCQFTSNSAKPGRCTQYPEVLAIGEIEEIIELNAGGVRHWFDEASDSYIMIYNETQWVAYIDSAVKVRRTEKYKNLGFGGTVDWSIDYQGKPTVYLPPLP
jgi:chitinase